MIILKFSKLLVGFKVKFYYNSWMFYSTEMINFTRAGKKFRLHCDLKHPRKEYE